MCKVAMSSPISGVWTLTDKLQSLVREWQSLIESHVDVKTTDNYMLRIFCIGFTKKRPNQIKHTCYAQSSQIHQVCASISICESSSLNFINYGWSTPCQTLNPICDSPFQVLQFLWPESILSDWTFV